jgi:hypothetical protein
MSTYLYRPNVQYRPRIFHVTTRPHQRKNIGMKNICFNGEKVPASLDEICDVVVRVSSSCTPRIQEMHILIGHVLCEYIERELSEGK